MKKNLLFLLLCLLVLPILANSQNITNPKREFRGVWIATVANIDWPSKPGLNSDIQKSELIRILDAHHKTGINAVIFQIRPATDALYGKSRELWSRFLTGTQGKAPTPYYDPLEFAIEEAHKRGMELHAWFNPYRATFDLIDFNTSPNHITKQKPEWFFTYGGKKLFNPGLPEVRQYIVDVILDVVKNYDIDGVHFDDYFYPYPEANQPLKDSETFKKHGSGFKNIDDWRRNNVDTLIHALSNNIRITKKHVKFGISPFGIWRNKSQDPLGSVSNGFDGYGKLYADARKWVQRGWIDYLNPQIYFPFGYQVAPYDKLTDWWADNAFGKHVYIGQAAYRATENRLGWSNRQQIPDQIRYLRKNSNIQGSVFFSSKSVTNNLAGVQDSLRTNFYRYPALQPTMPWIDAVKPNAPRNLIVKSVDKVAELSWEEPLVASDGEKSFGYVVYRFNKSEKIDSEQAKNIVHISFDASKTSFTDTSVSAGQSYVYILRAIDRLKNESEQSNSVSISVK
ncbi:family 10 glycosylhydrolase [Daejeonella sp.]|uniref:glycoside hydrolase family 10 protein n=1 Tax=Daejeonella sp. TaxID=2805397 RepID=UPI0025BE21EE|nr:family 10 glycosylhydrolase [Daejeonella sp.]